MITKAKLREFLQLADVYDPEKHRVGGWFLSEKLDGTRCFWDGGISRGLSTDNVPWASVTDPKTGGRKKKIKPFATGLWTRYGNPIYAPDSFLDQLPHFPLDGELFAGRGNFALCRSICAGDTPDPRFSQIRFAVFSSPPLDIVTASGEIKNPNFHAVFDHKAITKFVHEYMDEDFRSLVADTTFQEELLCLQEELDPDGVAYLHPQIKLPEDEEEARDMIQDQLDRVVRLGGEGLILRNPSSIWTPRRTKNCLKIKPIRDDEGTLTGFVSGRKTHRGSKLLGKIGALVLDYQGKRLELAGLTDQEREFATSEWSEYAAANPGVDMPAHIEGRHFKKGQKVTFIYSELSDDGIPLKARYYRLRGEE